jgi:hypothetical protein
MCTCSRAQPPRITLLIIQINWTVAAILIVPRKINNRKIGLQTTIQQFTPLSSKKWPTCLLIVQFLSN